MSRSALQIHTLSSSDEDSGDELVSLATILSQQKSSSDSNHDVTAPRSRSGKFHNEVNDDYKGNSDNDVITLDDSESSNSRQSDCEDLSHLSPTEKPILGLLSDNSQLPSFDSRLKSKDKVKVKTTLGLDELNDVSACKLKNGAKMSSYTEITTKKKQFITEHLNDENFSGSELDAGYKIQQNCEHVALNMSSSIDSLTRKPNCAKLDVKVGCESKAKLDIPVYSLDDSFEGADLNVSLLSRCKPRENTNKNVADDKLSSDSELENEIQVFAASTSSCTNLPKNTHTNSKKNCSDGNTSSDLELESEIQVLKASCAKSSNSSKPKDNVQEANDILASTCSGTHQGRKTSENIHSLPSNLQKARQYAIKNESSDMVFKHLKIVIDEQFIESRDGSKLDLILAKLQNEKFNISYEIREQLIQNTVTWMRAYPSENHQYESSSDDVEMQWIDEDQVLVILQMTEFLPMIEAYKQVCLFGQQKAKQNKELKNTVLGIEPSQPKRKKKNPLQQVDISAVDIEEVIVDMQLRSRDCNIHFAKDVVEVADTIMRFSKAIAQAPYKNEQQKNHFSWFLDAENRSCVKVDKSGKFLTDLWIAQIQCFANVGTDTSEAIVAKYSTPQSLLRAYHKSDSVKDAQLLMENIMIRRQAGPLSTSRRVGPELSKKVHAFFTSKDGEKLLHKL
ncbi:Crossover junction endonuclease EME1 [Nymphon striatum]|nr:Crossover junction endonuclease EME1 [Nymphon striatum]